MKKLLTTVLLSVFLVTGAFAEYNPDKLVGSDENMITTFSFNEADNTMHQSWDLDFDGMNDCENDGTCDHTVDYTKAKTYPTSAKFLEAEGNICKSATDGCNTVMINNGELGAMTEMYCEDTYGQDGQEKWSCNSYDEKKVEELRMQIQTMVPQEDMKICTMEYAPVCAEVQVQCIKAPCLPVAETFGNACSAGDNKILYTGECSEYVDTNKYNRYKKQESALYPIIEKASTKRLENAIVTLDTSIENTKLLRIARWVQNERITTYTFLKHLLENVLKTRY